MPQDLFFNEKTGTYEERKGSVSLRAKKRASKLFPKRYLIGAAATGIGLFFSAATAIAQNPVTVKLSGLDKKGNVLPYYEARVDDNKDPILWDRAVADIYGEANLEIRGFPTPNLPIRNMPYPVNIEYINILGSKLHEGRGIVIYTEKGPLLKQERPYFSNNQIIIAKANGESFTEIFKIPMGRNLESILKSAQNQILRYKVFADANKDYPAVLLTDSIKIPAEQSYAEASLDFDAGPRTKDLSLEDKTLKMLASRDSLTILRDSLLQKLKVYDDDEASSLALSVRNIVSYGQGIIPGHLTREDGKGKVVEVFYGVSQFDLVIKDNNLEKIIEGIKIERSPVFSGYTVNTSKAFTLDINQLKEPIPFLIIGPKNDSIFVTPNQYGYFEVGLNSLGDYLIVIDNEDFLKTSHIFEVDKILDSENIVFSSPHRRGGREGVNEINFGQSVMGMNYDKDNRTFTPSKQQRHKIFLWDEEYKDKDIEIVMSRHVLDVKNNVYLSEKISDELIEFYRERIKKVNEFNDFFPENITVMDSIRNLEFGKAYIITEINSGGVGGYAAGILPTTKRVVRSYISMDLKYYSTDPTSIFWRGALQEFASARFHHFELGYRDEPSMFFVSGAAPEFTSYDFNSTNLCRFAEIHVNAFEKEGNLHKTYVFPFISEASKIFYQTNPGYKDFVDKNTPKFAVEQYFK